MLKVVKKVTSNGTISQKITERKQKVNMDQGLSIRAHLGLTKSSSENRKVNICFKAYLSSTAGNASQIASHAITCCSCIHPLKWSDWRCDVVNVEGESHLVNTAKETIAHATILQPSLSTSC